MALAVAIMTTHRENPRAGHIIRPFRHVISFLSFKGFPNLRNRTSQGKKRGNYSYQENDIIDNKKYYRSPLAI